MPVKEGETTSATIFRDFLLRPVSLPTSIALSNFMTIWTLILRKENTPFRQDLYSKGDQCLYWEFRELEIGQCLYNRY